MKNGGFLGNFGIRMPEFLLPIDIVGISVVYYLQKY